MQIVDFRELYLFDYQLHKLVAMNQCWYGREYWRTNNDRATSALVYLKECYAEYQLASGKLRSFPKGSVVYIPQGSQYRYQFYPMGDSRVHTQLIEFELTDPEGVPFICSEEICEAISGAEVFHAFDETVQISGALTLSYGEFRSVLYGLLTKIAAHHQKKALHSKAFFPIAPAIRYLQKTPCTDLGVQELAQMCHVSEGCFRSLFKQYSGKSPSRFCLDNRIQKAILLLQSNMYSVSEVAELVGYKDAGYFTKVFKKETGKLPSEYFRTGDSALF